MERPFPAYTGDEPYIFVSYAHEDNDRVFPEIQWLKDQGVNIWYDEGISPGSRWSEELARNIVDAGLFLYFVTPNSVKSKHCQDEINLALEAEIPTLVVQLEATELTPGLRLRLNAHQAILKQDLNIQDYREKLLTGIDRYLLAPDDVGDRKRGELKHTSTTVTVDEKNLSDRRLTAILAADVSGYTRLMESDEDRTHARVQASRKIFKKHIEAVGGRIFNTAGDSVMAEFDSIVEGTQAAVRIQDDVAEQERDSTPDNRIAFRIGMHIGEVMQDDTGDLFGECVNIAARLEQAGTPGQITISETVHGYVKNRIEVPVEPIGSVSLKNVAKPMPLYSLVPDSADQIILPQKKTPLLTRGRKVAAALAAVILIFITLFSVVGTRQWMTEAGITLAIKAVTIFVSQELKQELGIAVLPFVNMSSDAENEYFSDGISEEILNALVKTNRMPVIARTSSFQFKGRNEDIKEIGRALGVTHILEGSVRKVNNSVRITAQLVDALTGAHLWSETYDRELMDLFAIQDEIAAKITDQIGLELIPSESDAQGVQSARGTTNPQAYELYLKTLHLVNSGNPYEIEKAIPLFKQALTLDQDYADAWAGLGITYVKLAAIPIFKRIPSETNPIAIEALRTALKIEPTHAHALGFLGMLLISHEYQWNEGLRLLEQAVTLNPNDAILHALYGNALTITKHEKAISIIDKAYRLNPYDTFTILIRANQLMLSGRALDSVALIETSLIQDRERYDSNVLVALFNLGIGRINLAERYLARARKIVGAEYPFIRVMDYMIAFSNNNQDLADQIKNELFELTKTSRIGLVYLIRWNKDQFVEILDLAVAQRHSEFLQYLFMNKHPLIHESDWQRILKITRVSDANVGKAHFGNGRTDEERIRLKSAAKQLSENELGLYVGVFEYTEGEYLHRVEKDGNKLYLVFPVGDRYELVPAGNNQFDVLEYNEVAKFIVENGEVARLERSAAQMTYVFIKKANSMQ
jgi:adenylate cyclase